VRKKFEFLLPPADCDELNCPCEPYALIPARHSNNSKRLWRLQEPILYWWEVTLARASYTPSVRARYQIVFFVELTF